MAATMLLSPHEPIGRLLTNPAWPQFRTGMCAAFVKVSCKVHGAALGDKACTCAV
jgi:hypothetical protein